MNNISIVEKKCFGCRSCEHICPQKCISFTEDNEGFIFPKIDVEKCINCGKCVLHCPVMSNDNFYESNSMFYVAKNKNKNRIMQSASGGIADVLSKYILEQNGVVFGSAYDIDLNVNHIYVDKEEQLSLLQSSKYVFSDTNTTYLMVKKLLLDNKKVLYTGTSCQIKGLLSFLGKDYNNLYTISLICHGVPPLKLFKEYIKFLEKKYNSKIIEYNFRDKSKFGWGTNVYIKFENGKKIRKPLKFDEYGMDFLNGENYRECCYSCPFANTKRIGDISLGDFWGINKFYPEKYDEKGVSLILINSEKGKRIIKLISDKIEIMQVTKESAVYKQENLKKPTVRPEIRDSYFFHAYKGGYFRKKIIKKSLKDRLLLLIPKKIKKIIKRVIKK